LQHALVYGVGEQQAGMVRGDTRFPPELRSARPSR